MGSRGRSIRLRIYFLVAIPLIMMIALAGVFSYTSITSWLNLERAPKLINATSVPITQMVNLLQSERRAGVVYLAHQDVNDLHAYASAVAATRADVGPLNAAINSGATKSSENAQETAAIGKLITDVNGLAKVRAGVTAGVITPLQAFGAYTEVITDAPKVFQAEATSLTNNTAATQGLALIQTVNAHEDLAEQDAMVADALVTGTLTPEERVVFDQAAGRQQDATLIFSALFSPAEVAQFNNTLNTLAPKAVQNQVTTIQQAVEGGATIPELTAQGLNSATWQKLTATLMNAHYQGGLAAAAGSLANDQQIINSFKARVYVIGALGLAGLLFTLIVTVLLARSVNRRLTKLRRNAVALATEHLPNVVARLRRGENVDVAAEAPALRVGSDEIGQVGQAFDMVRQTALRSAVEESRLRQGVNDMFRNLARRNQSLLQRQLTMLDGMERRATDPDVLDDLFKMDHLTTRMRRHAEGLIILSGAAPGRGWSSPVKLIDVMRGAVAEVEDFARVIVTTQSKAALTGSAVTDVIHLLAELIENATTLSPPFTQVRVHGEMVANGFAIEIEDRGLGMTPMRMGELNERLANPPDVNPANTEQLGLFVVGQLARRHGINVVLRPSPYGGTTAVVMIPQRLVVDDSTPALTTGPQAAAGAAAAFGAAPLGAPGVPGSPVPGGYGPNGSDGFNGPPNGGNGSNGLGGSNGFSGDSRRRPAGAGFPASAAPQGGSSPAPSSPPDLDNIPISSPPFGAPGSRGNGRGRPSGPGRGGPRSPDDPVITGVPVTKPTGRPSFGDLPPRRGSDGGAPIGGGPSSYSSSSFYGSGSTSEPSAGSAPYPSAGGPSNTESNSYGSSSFDAGNGFGNNGGTDGGFDAMGPGGGDDANDFKGLPRRTRQANLAPQLRNTSRGESGGPQAPAPNPADVKNTLSAMQRGWQQGRAQSGQGTEASDGI
jgi:signal transduction histidine kinase